MNYALVPVKALAGGKSRLSALLSEDVRHAVSRAMLLDVLTSLRQAQSVDKTVVVSSDATLLALAQDYGTAVVNERHPRGLSGATNIGTDFCLEQGATALLVLLADLPLVTADDIDLLFHHAEEVGDGIILTPCKEGDGTNALLRVPPLVLPPFFGGPSLEAHRVAAQRNNVACRVVEVPHIAFDVDSIKDLAQFAAQPSDTRTYRVLQEAGVVQELKALSK